MKWYDVKNKVRSDLRNGYTIPEAARNSGISTVTVYRSINKRNEAVPLKYQVMELRNHGYSYSEIADALGVTDGTVATVVSRLIKAGLVKRERQIASATS